MGMGDTGNMVKATNSTFDIIQHIHAERGARLTDIADGVGLSKSAVHSHLNTLRHRGYVDKTGEIYKLSPKFFHLGQSVRSQNRRYQLVQAKVAELAEVLNLSIDFDIETDGRVMTLFHQADESTEVGLSEGDYLPMHTSATGKAILAELPDDRVTETFDTQEVSKQTEHTITEQSILLSELAEIRERGYAISDQEWLEGLGAVGVAVLQPDGQPLGALSAGGPTYRLTDDAIEEEIAPALQHAATELEEDISTVFA